MMETANELVDQHLYTEACKTLKNVEDAVKFSLNQESADQVPFN